MRTIKLMTTPTQDRDRATGQFVHTSEWDRLCVCGHTLGVHTAASVRGKRHCIAGDFGHEHCDCERFRKARAPK